MVLSFWAVILVQDFVKYVLLPHGMIIDRCEKLAQEIRAAYAGSTPHFLVVLKGGNEFASDLTRAIREQHAHSGAKHVPFVVDFVRVKSYEGTETTGKGALGEEDSVSLDCSSCRLWPTRLAAFLAPLMFSAARQPPALQ